MALPRRLDHAVSSFLDGLEGFRSFLLGKQQQMLSSVQYGVIEEVQDKLARAWNDIEDLSNRAGVIAYVRNQYGNQTSDIAASAQTLQNTVETALTTVRNGTPLSNPGSFVAAYQLSAGLTDDPQWVQRTVTPAQTATLRGNIDSIVNAIDALSADLLG